ncbi:MocR-like pyridoxine biosynthesis transcription factor PdxR [Catellatospora vulcania]|uniref:MocR-like pyridoxine biosynthesis transcription factor PdxR n=1 Tax=Catellatospora vulcania TaxID=1460450 RepID=UPI001E54F9C1|nr:PLP-dependent aminotransferase family protein [Catellatospora vulcania]
MAVREALVDLDRSRPGVGERLTGALRDAIAQQRIAPGTRLPSSRDLAADLGVSRGLVVSAYEQLSAEGRLVSRRGSGTVVAPAAAEAAVPGPLSSPPAPTGVAPLRPGVPDLGMFPRAAWRRAYERALATALDTDLDYTDPAGVPRLRAELASYLGRVRAARVSPDAVVVTTGAAQALSLLGRVLAARGMHEVGVEDPGSAGIRDHLLAHGLRLRPVPVDDRGLVVSALGEVHAVFVTPAHQFPVGAVLAPDRRAELIAWARRTGGLVIEDDYDAEFRYDREPVGCLQGLAPDVVALVGSASKALAPGLRRGWLAPPPGWLAAVRQAKCDADMGGSALEQLAFAELLASGGYDRHLRRARRAQRTRRDALVGALRRHLPQARVSGIAAGLHLVAELPAAIDDHALAARARAAGLGPLALSDLRLGTTGPPGLVLGYAAQSPDELAAAVAALADLL